MKFAFDASWNESDHPRDGGKFTFAGEHDGAANAHEDAAKAVRNNLPDKAERSARAHKFTKLAVFGPPATPTSPKKDAPKAHHPKHKQNTNIYIRNLQRDHAAIGKGDIRPPRHNSACHASGEHRQTGA